MDREAEMPSPVGSGLALSGETENVYGGVPRVAASGSPAGSLEVVYAVPARNAPMEAVVMARPDACDERSRSSETVLPMLSVTVKVNGALVNEPAFVFVSTPPVLRARL